MPNIVRQQFIAIEGAIANTDSLVEVIESVS